MRLLWPQQSRNLPSVLEAMRDAVLYAQYTSRRLNTRSDISENKYFYIDGQMVDKHKSYATNVSIAFSDENPNLMQTVFAFISAFRNKLAIPTSIERVDIHSKTIINRNASEDFLKYILNLDYQLYGAQADKNAELITNLEKWFKNLQNALREIYDCPGLQLNRDTKNLAFNISLPGRAPFKLHEMSDGYAAFLDIFMELLMRLESEEAVVSYDQPAIVLIDEIETHLHVELQKRVLPFLTRMFPKIQFIVATHSPFVITSLENAVVYDLEKKEALDNFKYYKNLDL